MLKKTPTKDIAAARRKRWNPGGRDAAIGAYDPQTRRTRAATRAEISEDLDEALARTKRRGRPFGATGPYKLDGAWYWQLAQDVGDVRCTHWERYGSSRDLSLLQIAKILRKKFPAKYRCMTVARLGEVLLLRKPVAPRRHDVPVAAWNWAAQMAEMAAYGVDLTEEQVGLFLLHSMIANAGEASAKFQRWFLIPRLRARVRVRHGVKSYRWFLIR